MDKRWWGTYGSLFVTGLSAFGYVVGVAAVAQFASTLGVGVQDLGLGTREYVTLAAIYGGGVVAVVGVSVGYVLLLFGYLFPRVVAAAAGESRRKRNALVVVLMALIAPLWIIPIGLLAAFTNLLGVYELNGWTVGLVVSVVGALGMLGREIAVSVDGWGRPDDRAKWWSVGRLVVVPPSTTARAVTCALALLTSVITAAFPLRAATLWADELADGKTPRGGLALGLVLQPTTGRVSDHDGCVVRVSPLVHIIDGDARIGEVDSFTSGDCSPGRN